MVGAGCCSQLMRILNAAILLLLPRIAVGAEVLDFNRDIRPILSENCFHCHGADGGQRQAELRLDLLESAVDSGAIVPGKPEESLLVERIRSTEPELQMPPPHSHRSLTPVQVETLVRWIEEGAPYDKHWAFKPIERPASPWAPADKWCRNDIDRFVREKLDANDLTPSLRAPLPALLRRLSLDLTGLPPNAEQIARWQELADPAAAAVEDLLSSPHFGERMATEWLDVARYADTHGFNNDAARTMWPWRDWVVKALNDNMPYDEFITQQLASDLLPHATSDQRLATGFNRNHVINSEGGIIDEEYRVEYVADRVRTTSLAWLGLTLECARCHDHKFDPISQREYYQFFAFFNNVDETGEDGRVANAAPLMPAPSTEDRVRLRELKGQETEQLKRLRLLIKDAASRELPASVASGDAEPAQQSQPAIDLFPAPQSFPDAKRDAKPTAPLNSKEGWTFSAWIKRQDEGAAGPLVSTMNYKTPRSAGSYGAGAEVGLTSEGAVEVRLAVRWPAYATQVISRRLVAANEWGHVAVIVTGNKASNVRIFVDGIESATTVRHDGLTGDVAMQGPVRVGHTNDKNDNSFVGEIHCLQMFAGPIDSAAFESVIEGEISRLPATESLHPHRLTRSQRFVTNAARLSATDGKIADALKSWRETHAKRLTLERSFPHVMVMQEMPEPREAFVLLRGQYDLHGERVTPDVPAAIGLPLEGAPRNRLALARWFTDPRHPLTARVVMNRLWQQFFGVGLVKTSSDFGMQSEWPSHPELLDWLAAEFIASGWDLKHMVRLIAESATYQQDSAASSDLWRRDPENRLHARGPRQRLTAEMIRDQALAVSGLLNPVIGGPPAYPYQPADYYKGIVVAANYPGASYMVGTGGDLYRRSLYTFWKRTVPHPTLATFDSPDREFCVARRSPTNTPLQALALMNDPTFLEAARKLGERMLIEGGGDDAARLTWGFRLVTARDPSTEEVSMLRDLLDRQRRDFADGVSAPQGLLNAGAAERQTKVASDEELAAYASLGSLLLNLDEAVNRN